MNRYDYYTRCVNFDEQEWLTEELYYPEDDSSWGGGYKFDGYEELREPEYNVRKGGEKSYENYTEDELFEA